MREGHADEAGSSGADSDLDRGAGGDGMDGGGGGDQDSKRKRRLELNRKVCMYPMYVVYMQLMMFRVYGGVLLFCGGGAAATDERQ